MKIILTIIFFGILCNTVAIAQNSYLPYNNETDPTWISPKYFGPNAFPVPDILKNTTEKLRIETNIMGALGRLTPVADQTTSVDIKLRIPLWTDRVNLSVWVQAWEWFWDNEETRKARRVRPEKPLSGSLQGDYYFSVDMLILRETQKRPAITLRAACKSASGYYYDMARYYDAPGYFFDVCVSKDFNINNTIKFSAAATTGFLCWQVDNGRQNDAVMYGASLGIKSKPVNFAADFGGYIGWKNEGDKPMTLKLRADIIPWAFASPFISYQRGFIDWPFDQIKVGVTLSIKILKNKS